MLGGSGAYVGSPEKFLKMWCSLVRFGHHWLLDEMRVLVICVLLKHCNIDLDTHPYQPHACVICVS